MSFIRNLLAIVGLLAIITAIFGYQKFGGSLAALNSMDPEARGVYTQMWQKLKETGNSADATVWRVPLEEGVSPEDAEEAMKIKANDLNIRSVGELPLSQQVELETGEKQRFLKIYQYCNPQTAMRMVDYSDSFSAYLPCRIALVEGQDGTFALYSLNMDLMIYGGKPLPDALKQEALEVKEIIQAVMASGAAGDFF